MASKSCKASIYVQTDKPFYFSGEIVKGNIFLNIEEEGFPGNILYLKVDGQEKCDWYEDRQESYRDSEGKVQFRTVTDHYEGNNSFYSHKIQLHQFIDLKYLPSGQLIFPFQFSLLDHLPGSFQKAGSRYKASILYELKAEVYSNREKSNKFEHSKVLVVSKSFRGEVKALEGEVVVQSKTWCCIKQGESKIKCVFDKNAYLPGDEALLYVDIDNSDCNLDIKEIRGVLFQHIILKSNQGREFRISHTMVTQRIDGIPARSHAMDENRKNMTLVLLNQIGDQNDRVLQPSTDGNLVKSQYSLLITALLSGCTCCVDDPSVGVFIEIIPTGSIQEKQVQPHKKSQTFEPVLIEFKDSDIYAKDPNVQQNFNYPSQNQNIQDLNQFNHMNQGNNQQYEYKGPNQYEYKGPNQ